MVRLLLSPFIFFLFCHAQAQFYVWSEPVPITDSVHDNINSCIYIGDPLLFADVTFIVWEQLVDSVSTAIFARNLDEMTVPFPLLSQSGVQFKNPKRIPVWDQEIYFFLFYETNQNGNWDIFYIKYMKDGSVTTPVPVCMTSADERNLNYSEYRGIVWQQDETVVHQEYSITWGFPPTSQPVIIDSGNCLNPVFSGYYCAWEKVVNNISQVWFSTLDYVTGQYIWSSPALADSSGDNASLFMGEYLRPEWLLWQHMDNGLWRINGMDLFDMNPLSFPDFPGNNNINPWFIELMFPVNKDDPMNCPFLTWASDNTGNMEIYVNETGWSSFFVNISESEMEDRCPRLYADYKYSVRVYLTWESYRNDHWQIWMTYQDVPIGVPEYENSNIAEQIKTFPNPFTSQTTIEFALDKPGLYRVEIFSSIGQVVLSFTRYANQSGNQKIGWNGQNSLGIKLPTGLYNVRIQTTSQLIYGQLILQ
ncbi:MAG: T9SS type A sorting domain-containing protein [Bacteroidales bacterium]|nr:T9SS type A sorting domain-containing protein [Bacteroidales bacterium]